jgi:phosphoenolpyruvate carboxylase
MRVVPLFETLSDLDAARSVMSRLLNNPWYRNHLANVHGNQQEVMLGYSDSGGRLSGLPPDPPPLGRGSAWALHSADVGHVGLQAGLQEFGQHHPTC